MQVTDLMTAPVFTCAMYETADLAVQIMWERDCAAIAVTDANGSVVGVVTDRDICLAAYFQRAPLSSISVENVMSQDACTCRPDDDLGEAERRMREHQVRRIAVVDASGLPVGILSAADVARRIDGAGAQSSCLHP